MKRIVRIGRRFGKLTQMIRKSAKYNTAITVRNEKDYNRIIKIAKELDLQIPEPIKTYL